MEKPCRQERQYQQAQRIFIKCLERTALVAMGKHYNHSNSYSISIDDSTMLDTIELTLSEPSNLILFDEFSSSIQALTIATEAAVALIDIDEVIHTDTIT